MLAWMVLRQQWQDIDVGLCISQWMWATVTNTPQDAQALSLETVSLSLISVYDDNNKILLYHIHYDTPYKLKHWTSVSISSSHSNSYFVPCQIGSESSFLISEIGILSKGKVEKVNVDLIPGFDTAAKNEKYPEFSIPLVIKMYAQLSKIVSNSKSMISMNVFILKT